MSYKHSVFTSLRASLHTPLGYMLYYEGNQCIPPMKTTKHELVTRLARIEGQVTALKRSLESDADLDCGQTLIQVKAATNALKRFAEAFSQEYAHRCVSEKIDRKELESELNTIITSAFTLS